MTQEQRLKEIERIGNMTLGEMTDDDWEYYQSLWNDELAFIAESLGATQ